MAGTCTARPLHTLDTVERPFYIPRTHTQQHSPLPPCRDPSHRRSPAIFTASFSAPVRAFFSRTASDHPLPQEVLAKRNP
jgi:hypothetical protein